MPKVWGSTHLEPWFPTARRRSAKCGSRACRSFRFSSSSCSPRSRFRTGASRRQDGDVAHSGGRAGREDRRRVSREISEERLRSLGALGRNRRAAGMVEARPGDTFFIPAGTVHAIGAGLTLCEIQQWSDVTYRLYDYGRPRELHLEKACASASSVRIRRGRGPAKGCWFRARSLPRKKFGWTAAMSRNAKMIVVLEGNLKIDGQPASAGEVWYADADADRTRRPRDRPTYVLREENLHGGDREGMGHHRSADAAGLAKRQAIEHSGHRCQQRETPVGKRSTGQVHGSEKNRRRDQARPIRCAAILSSTAAAARGRKTPRLATEPTTRRRNSAPR